MKSIEEIRREFAFMLVEGVFRGDTIELIGESFIADEDSIFGDANEDYIQRELAWYLKESLNVNEIPGNVPKIWQDVSAADGSINSNYGYLLKSPGNGSQMKHVVDHLVRDPLSRRAVAIYTRPSIHTEWNHDGMSDFICTNAVNYFIRDGAVHAVVQMRSNDVVYGYRNDIAWQRYALQMVQGNLALRGVEVKLGEIIWNAASLHIYSRHYHLVEKWIEDQS